MRFSPGGIRVILVVVMSVSTGESTRAENFFWIVEEGTLYRIDVNDLAVTTVGNIGVEGSDYGGLAYDRSTDILYGLLDRRRDSILVEIDRLTGEATPIGSSAPVSPGAWFSGFDISPSSQAIARTLSRIGPEQETTSVALFHIDLTTGEATRKVASPDILGRTDMAYASDGRLYDIARNRPDGPLLTLIDDETGAVGATIGEMPVSDILPDVALGYNPDDQMLYYLSSPKGLYRVDPATGHTDRLVDFSGLPTEEDEYIGTFAPMPVLAQLEGDFNANGVLDAADVDALAAEITSAGTNANFDVNNDDNVNSADHTAWVKELKNTWFGDANLDGEFNSRDLVNVFSAGHYETGTKVGWAEGNWDTDEVFGTGDLIVAFQDGGFEIGPVEPVPEPSYYLLVLFSTVGLALTRRRRELSCSPVSLADGSMRGRRAAC